MDELYSMTVAQLKERLKEEGLPVSGKKAELIARLREGEQESFVPDEKYEIGCAKCGTTLRVPTDYSGGTTCPNCMTKSQVTNQLTTDEESNLTGIVSDLQGTGASLNPWLRVVTILLPVQVGNFLQSKNPVFLGLIGQSVSLERLRHIL